VQLRYPPVEDRVAKRTSTGRARLSGPVRTRGDLGSGLGKDPADRLDPVLVAMNIDERIDVFYRRSSSACAKYALA
jgi:hypothetical protein